MDCHRNSGMSLREVNWLGGAPAAGEGLGVAVKVRSTTPAVAATAFAAGEGARVVFAEPQNGVAPGQACVLYAGARVLGGGSIARAEAAVEAAGSLRTLTPNIRSRRPSQ